MNDINSRDIALTSLGLMLLPIGSVIGVSQTPVLFAVGLMISIVPEWALLLILLNIPAGKASRPIGALLSILLSILSVILVFYFADRLIPALGSGISLPLVITLMIISAAYMISLSHTAAVRVSKALLTLAVLLFLLTLALAIKNGDVTNLNISSKTPAYEVLSGVLWGITLALPSLYILSLRFISGRKLKGVLCIYTPVKAALVLLFTPPVIFVEGNVSGDISPAYRFSTYASGLLLERGSVLYLIQVFISAVLLLSAPLSLTKTALTRRIQNEEA